MKMLTFSLILAIGLVGLLIFTPSVQSAEDASQDTAMADFDPATVMPADTKVYVELGSPGKQLETILNLFEGTPLEDSLTTLLSQGGSQTEGPARIIQGIMNPAMIAEFKKIQGAAVGITGINDEMPEFVAVLSPGKSDALRGVLMAGISMAGKPAESVDGIQSWIIEDAVAVAYDGTIFIAANSPDKLAEAVTRHKNRTVSSSLADSALFQKVDKDQRAANVITVWADGKQTYQELTRLMQAEGDTEELAIVNMIADPAHIERLLLQLSMQDNDIVLDVDLTLDEDHQCHAYNIARTPALSSKGLATVPSDAIVLAGFSLGDADSPAAEKFQGTLKQMTGLEIGREIFANIEQINVFVVAPQNVTDIKELPVASIGIAITSKNGEKTKSFLDTLFQTANQAMQASGEFDGLQADAKEGRYTIPIDDIMLPCYLEQKGNVTVLSPSRQIISKCFRASESKTDRAAAGLLKPVLENTSTTNKLIVVNAGGVVRFADAVIMMEHQNPFNPAHQQLSEFSQLLDGMNICIRTSETPNRLNLNASVNDIPPLGSLFPKAMALAECDFGAKGCATDPVPCHQGAVGPKQTYQLQWQPGIGSQSHKVYFGTNASDLKLLREISNASAIDGPALADSVETYYWRVDEIMPNGTVIAGDVWNFGRGTMIARWKLDESTGLVAKDTSGQNHDGMLTSEATWHPAEGIQAGAIELDGKDDAIEIKDLSFVTNNATFTAWVKGWKAADWSGIVFSRTPQPCGMHFGQNNTLHYTWNNDSSQTYNWTGGPVIPENQWAFVAIVIQPDKTTAYVYDKNNGLQSAENNVRNIPQNVYDLKIGCDTHQRDRFFKGMVDDVRIYNYALSQQELEALTLKQTASL